MFILRPAPAPLRSTPLHSAPLRSTPLHSALLRSTPLHSAPLRSSASLLLICYSLSVPLFLIRSYPIFLLHSALPRLSTLALTLFRSDLLCSFPSALPLRSTHSALLNSDRFNHALLCLLCLALLDQTVSVWIRLLYSALYFSPLDVLVTFRINCLILVCTIAYKLSTILTYT